MNEWFVQESSIVRKIWGNPDTILFVFAGSSAEFALNKAVDWLFYTGKLPADPLGRLFSTVTYARLIVFSQKEEAFRVIDNMAKIHHTIEENRGAKIPDWAYRDVLYMLIDYSIRSYELLQARITLTDKEEVYDVFYAVGNRMGVKNLPSTYRDWITDREQHMVNDLVFSSYTRELYKQYRKHLGFVRYGLLKSAQGVIVPETVRDLLQLKNSLFFRLVIKAYKVLIRLNLDGVLKQLILPRKYIPQIKALKN